MKKVGVFGGTFSSPHNGHVEAAKAFIDELDLNSLIVMPTNIPPHKTVKDNDPIARYNMACLAFSDIPKTEVSNYEISRCEKSYTAKTLSYLKKEDISLFFLCGTDMFLTLKDWYRPDIICALSTIVLTRRNSECDAEIMREKALLCEKYSASVIILKHEPLDISSTIVRQTIKAKGDISTLVPEKVREYIYSHRLYENG